MAGEQTNGHAKSRLDRLEGLMELLIEDHLKFRDEHRQLLTAQVVLTDGLDRLVRQTNESQRRTDEQIRELRERTDEQIRELRESLNTLIHVVDDLVRKRPPQTL